VLRGSVLICALVFSAPTLWQAFVTEHISVDTALIRFLIAIPVAAALLAIVRAAAKPPEQRVDGRHPADPG
jgi:hypothetical protein